MMGCVIGLGMGKLSVISLRLYGVVGNSACGRLSLGVLP